MLFVVEKMESLNPKFIVIEAITNKDVIKEYVSDVFKNIFF
tara:strand:- start:573 stop:695 length:123 start_codon:yes stop_codon:yes gene_type:complete